MTDIIITKNKYIKSPNTIEEVFESMKNTQPKFQYQLDDILFISDTKITNINHSTLEITWDANQN